MSVLEKCKLFGGSVRRKKSPVPATLPMPVTNNESGSTVGENKSVLGLCSQFGGSIRRKKTPVRVPVPVPAPVMQTDSEIIMGKLSVEEFQLGKMLGEGTYGKVYLATTKNEKLFCVLKAIPKSVKPNPILEEMIKRERDIQRDLRHPHIVRMYNFFRDNRFSYMILEYLPGGDLMDLLDETPNYYFTNPEAARFVGQLAEALQYCHENKIIHRDVKPDNCVVTATKDIKLTDFGLAVRSPFMRQKTSRGTLQFKAPELLAKEVYNNVIDNWALGITTYYLLTGDLPFTYEEMDIKGLLKEMEEEQHFYPDQIPKNGKLFIWLLLAFDPSKRIPLKDALEQDWLVENRKLDDQKRFG